MANVIKTHNQRLALVLFRVLKKYTLNILRLRVNDEKLKQMVLPHFNIATKIPISSLYDLALKELQPYIKKRNSTVDEKKLKCIIKEFTDPLDIVFIENFYLDLDEEFNNNFLPDMKKLVKTKKLLPMDISAHFSNLDYILEQIETPYLKYNILPFQKTDTSILTMYKELRKIDCHLHTKSIRKVLKEYKIVKKFYITFETSLEKGFLKDLVQNQKIELDTRSIFLKKATKFRNTLLNTLGRHLEKLSQLMFFNAKKSQESITHFKKYAPNVKMTNFAFNKYLLKNLELQEDITQALKSANTIFQKQDKEVIAFIGNDSDMLHSSIKSIEEYIRKGQIKYTHLFGFTKEDIFLVWLKSNKPDKIIVSDDFVTKTTIGGLEYVKVLKSSHKNIKAIQNNNLFILTQNISSILEHNIKPLHYPLSQEAVQELILYN